MLLDESFFTVGLLCWTKIPSGRWLEVDMEWRFSSFELLTLPDE